MKQPLTRMAPTKLPFSVGSRVLSEANLIRLLRQRQEKAFSQLYDRYAGTLYRIVLRIVQEEALAEDLLQEAFVKIWHHFPDYDEQRGRLFTWMLNITRNLAIDRTRSAAHKHRRLIHSVEAGRKYPVSLCAYQPELTGLESLFPQLRAEEEILIELVFYQGYSRPEVAQRLDIPLGTVKSRLRAAMSKLRRCLGQSQSPRVGG